MNISIQLGTVLVRFLPPSAGCAEPRKIRRSYQLSRRSDSSLPSRSSGNSTSSPSCVAVMLSSVNSAASCLISKASNFCSMAFIRLSRSFKVTIIFGRPFGVMHHTLQDFAGNRSDRLPVRLRHVLRLNQISNSSIMTPVVHRVIAIIPRDVA